MTSDKEKVARQQQVARQTGGRRTLLEQNLHTSGKFCFHCQIKFQLHQYSLDGISLQNLFPLFQKSFFVKDCIEEITRFVAAVK